MLLVTAVTAYLPGLALLALVGGGSPLLRLAMAPAVSIGIAGAVAVLTALVGLPYGIVSLATVTIVLGAAAVVLRRRSPRPWKSLFRPVTTRDRTSSRIGGAMVAAGTAFPVWAWLRGLNGLATPAQEHDMIIHGMVAAYIGRTGHAAPWQIMPTDVLTGEPVSFYPAGAHLLTGALFNVTGDVFVSLNAVSVVLLAVAPCLGVAGLTWVAARQLGVRPGGAMLAAGIGALVMGGMYRPSFHLMHDGGILGNAVALCLVPGVVAGVLALPRLRPKAGVAVGLGVVGAVWAHPSAAVSVGLTVVAWWLGQSFTRRGRSELRASIKPLLFAAPGTLVLLTIAAGPGLSQAGRTGNWPPDTSPMTFVEAMGETFSFPYSGWIDQAQARSQVWVVLVLAVGASAIAARRRGPGPLVPYAVWSVVLLGAWVSPGRGFDAVVTQFYYNAMLRTWSHVSLLAPVIAAVGLVLIADRLAVLVRRATPVPLAPRWVSLAVATLVFVGFAAGPTVGYTAINEQAVAHRYGTPDFVRYGPDDRAAADWLASRIQPGQRVFNSGNDGSTLLYLAHGIPIVNVYTLGFPGVPYTYRLLEKFKRYPDDLQVRQQLIDLNVRWVYVDNNAPGIGSAGSPENWAGDDGFRLAPGLTNLAGLPGLHSEFEAGSVSVYSLDLTREPNTP